jgi:hypothetical protein
LNEIALAATLVTLVSILLGAAKIMANLDAAMAWAIWGAIVAVVIGFQLGKRRN